MHLIIAQIDRYNNLIEIGKNRFSNIKTIKASILKQPNCFLSSIILQKCALDKLDSKEVEIFFEIKDDNKSNDKMNGLVLTDLKVLGAQWDPIKKCLKKSEYLQNLIFLKSMIKI